MKSVTERWPGEPVLRLTVSRYQCVGSAFPGNSQDLILVGVCTLVRSVEQIDLVCEPDVETGAIRRGVNGDAGEPKLLARPDHSACDLAAVSDQDALDAVKPISERHCAEWCTMYQTVAELAGGYVVAI